MTGRLALPQANELLAGDLDEVADLLEAQGANPFRVRAYRNAAETIRGLDRPVHEILENEGTGGLQRLPAVGESLARSIEQLTLTGHLGLLDRLRGAGPEDLLITVPGIGPALAARIHETLSIESLADLESAAHDGRLAEVDGLGRRRIQMIRESLAGRLRRRQRDQPRPPSQPVHQPPVTELLDVDREYRAAAESGKLPRIAPRRFNPGREAWLPVLHTQRGERHSTALFSNTARAHEVGAIRDWVVIYRDDPDGGGQWTVVTGRFGALKGRRVLRGREDECKATAAAEPDRGLFEGAGGGGAVKMLL
jgi:putative hydrolase